MRTLGGREDPLSRSLQGRTAVVTRPPGQAASLTRRLEALGARVIEFPTIRIRPPSDPAPLRRAARSAATFDWIVFTSVNGVAALLDAVRADGRSPETLRRVRLAAIGPATADALREAGLPVEVVPDEFRAEALADALREAAPLHGARVLLPRADGARPALPERLRAAGARVDQVTAYETAPGDPDEEALAGRLRAGEVDWLTFTASSTVENFVRMVGTAIGPARVATIGPITAETAREAGLPVHAVADAYTIPGLVRALVAAEAVPEGG